MSNRRKALLFTAVPIVISSLISLFTKQDDLNKGLGIAWLIAGDIWIVAILTFIVFWRRKNKEIATGILIGIFIGTVSLALTIIILIAMHQ